MAVEGLVMRRYHRRRVKPLGSQLAIEVETVSGVVTSMQCSVLSAKGRESKSEGIQNL